MRKKEYFPTLAISIWLHPVVFSRNFWHIIITLTETAYRWCFITYNDCGNIGCGVSSLESSNLYGFYLMNVFIGMKLFQARHHSIQYNYLFQILNRFLVHGKKSRYAKFVKLGLFYSTNAKLSNFCKNRLVFVDIMLVETQ